MMENEVRDYVTLQDKEGNEKQYSVEALFDMEEKTYALLSSDEDTVLMRVERNGDEQYVVGISDPIELESVLNAYQIAVDAAPAE